MNVFVSGDALHLERATGLERDRWLELRAEMKLPGEAHLQFAFEPLSGRGSRLVQAERFPLRSLAGLVCRVLVRPLHGFVVRGMLRGLRLGAERAA